MIIATSAVSAGEKKKRDGRGGWGVYIGEGTGVWRVVMGVGEE